MHLKRVVVATDFSEVSLRALETAFSLDLGEGAILYLLHVIERPANVDPIVGWVRPPITERYEEAMERLASLIPVNRQTPAVVQREVVTGGATEEIARFAREKEADLIIVGTHGRKGLARMLMGSTAESLLREAPCQVLVVKPHSQRKAAEETLLKSAGKGL